MKVAREVPWFPSIAAQFRVWDGAWWEHVGRVFFLTVHPDAAACSCRGPNAENGYTCRHVLAARTFTRLETP